MKSRIKGVSIVVIGSLVGMAGCWCSTPSSDLQEAAVHRQLTHIEQQWITNIGSGPARFDGLPAYFRDANPDLFNHLDELIQMQVRGQDHSGVTYVAGASGVGKSYVIAHLPFVPGTATEPIKLSKCFTETRPDLQSLDGQVVFNRLPWADSFDIEAILSEQVDKPFILLDDLDEIHPDTALQVLDAVEVFVHAHRKGFVHVLVFGRPESFWPWLSHQPHHPQVHVTTLVGPNYQTSGDLAFCCQNYYDYKFSRPAPDDVIASFQSALQQSPFLRYTVRPLSAGNFVIKQCVTSSQHQDLRQGLLSDLLERDTESHHRPGPGDTRYLSLLEQAAAYPWTHHRPLDNQGFFRVTLQDVLTCTDDQGRSHTIRLMDLLSRSGLVTMDLKDTHTARFRFEPFWVQGYLLEQKPYPLTHHL